MTTPIPSTHQSPFGFPAANKTLEEFGLKFSAGGPHISRTMMLVELRAILAGVPQGAPVSDYRDAILVRNVLAKATDSTRHKSLRHLSELYALTNTMPIFRLLRNLHDVDPSSLALLAVQVAWARDPLLRATTQPVQEALDGQLVTTASLAHGLATAFPNRYSELNQRKIARNCASTWTQSGHLAGRGNKIRQRVRPTAAALTMALFLGDVAGYHGAVVFSNPWCRLLDLDSDRARTLGFEAHRSGLLTLRTLGEIVELSFPPLAEPAARPS